MSSKMDKGKQDKHIEGANNYNTQVSNGKNPSILSSDAQSLLDSFNKGEVKSSATINEVRTRVDFGQVIGRYFIHLQESTQTPQIIIHNSKTGAHIVPSAPN